MRFLKAPQALTCPELPNLPNHTSHLSVNCHFPSVVPVSVIRAIPMTSHEWKQHCTLGLPCFASHVHRLMTCTAHSLQYVSSVCLLPCRFMSGFLRHYRNACGLALEEAIHLMPPEFMLPKRVNGRVEK